MAPISAPLSLHESLKLVCYLIELRCYHVIFAKTDLAMGGKSHGCISNHPFLSIQTACWVCQIDSCWYCCRRPQNSSGSSLCSNQSHSLQTQYHLLFCQKDHRRTAIVSHNALSICLLQFYWHSRSSFLQALERVKSSSSWCFSFWRCLFPCCRLCPDWGCCYYRWSSPCELWNHSTSL